MSHPLLMLLVGIPIVVLDLILGWIVLVFLFGDDLPDPDHEGSDGISVLNAVMAFVLLQIIGLVKVLGPMKELDGWISTIYIAIAIPILGAFVGILRSTTLAESGKIRRTYNRGSIMFGKWALVWSAVLLFAFPVLAYFRLLPTQEKPRLEYAASLHVDHVKRHTFRSEGKAPTLGVQVVAYLRPKGDFAKGIPSDLLILARCDRELFKEWKLVGLRYVDLDGDKEAKPATIDRSGNVEFDRAIRKVPMWFYRIHGLVPSHNYRLEFMLYPRSKMTEERLKETLRRITSDKDRAFTTVAIPQQG